jgi:exopolysaccharide biosynthesis polyprenyl glycosylphosphotransferase
VKKDLAAFRYIDEKVLPLYVPDTFGPSKDTSISRAGASTLGLAIKRAIDIGSSLFVLVFGIPFYALIAVLIKLTSEGPVLFAQERIGQDGKPFKFYKFRTMVLNNDDEVHRQFAVNFIKGTVMNEVHPSNGQNVYKIVKDPRVTPIGKFLRRTSLDELPQFINVLKGEMSLVGPRPPLNYEIAHYKEWHKKRLFAKPGLTGLWQVSGRSTVPFEEMVALDLYYIENWSLLFDLKIILRTIPVMFFGFGAF